MSGSKSVMGSTVSSASSPKGGAPPPSHLQPQTQPFVLTATTVPAPATKSAAVAPAGAGPVTASVATTTTTTTTAVFGPLPSPRTITITFVPDWNQEAIRSPLRPATLFVVLGPANTAPEQARWVLTINLYAMDQHRGSSKKPEEESIGKGCRALLWFDGKPFPRYHHAVEAEDCKLTSADDLKTVSVVMRTFSEEKDPNSLVYVRRRYGVTRNQGAGYMKVVQGHHYYLNITFAGGSTIAQMVGQYGWRPMIYLNPRGPGEHREFDPANPAKGYLIFANFVTNWAQGVELVPDDREQRLSLQAEEQDLTDEDHAKMAAHPASTISHGVVRIAGVAVSRDPSLSAAVPHLAATRAGAVLQGQACAGGGIVLGGLHNATGGKCLEKKTNSLIGSDKSVPFQHALSPVTTAGPPLDTTLTNPNPGETTFSQLEWQINTNPLLMVHLPSLDTKMYQPDFSIEPNVFRFYTPSESALAAAMMAIEAEGRLLTLDPKHPANTNIKHMFSFFNAQNQLLGWQNVQRYLENPLRYGEAAKSLMFGYSRPNGLSSTGSAAVEAPRSLDELQQRAQLSMKRLCQRVDWILELQRNSNRQFDAELAVKIIAADRQWMQDTESLMKETEQKVVDMLHANQERFQQFREMQRRGVAWPHSSQLRVEIESAGWTYRPMMIKRDRCVCDDCGVEVNGWKPWHNPWAFHNFEKHKVKLPVNVLQLPNSAAISQQVTEANRRRAMIMAPVGLPTIKYVNAKNEQVEFTVAEAPPATSAGTAIVLDASAHTSSASSVSPSSRSMMMDVSSSSNTHSSRSSSSKSSDVKSDTRMINNVTTVAAAVTASGAPATASAATPTASADKSAAVPSPYKLDEKGKEKSAASSNTEMNI